ncbi:hypothetical protein HK405_011046, partial [Cladochytrium tenue]
MAKGNVQAKIYLLYLSAMGGAPYVITLVAGYALNIGLTTYLDVIVSLWSRSYQDGGAVAAFARTVVEPLWASLSSVGESFSATLTSANLTDDASGKYITMYAAVGACTIAAIVFRLILLLYGEVRAGRKVHHMMLKRMLWAPMRFFDSTPLGRIINRFSKDMASVDVEVPISAGNTIYQAVSLVVVFGTVASVIPVLVLAMIPLGYLYAQMGLYYIRTSRSLKRIDSVVRSPIFAHFSETLNGVTVIRAFHQSARFTRESSKRFEDANRAEYFLTISAIWTSVRIQTLGSLVIFTTGLLVLASGLSAGLVGLCINFILSISDTLIGLVRMQSMMEMSMNAIERCDEYLGLEQEAPALVPSHRPPVGWPAAGAVDIRGLELRYTADGPLVLCGVTASVLPREKVGVVGRTGAGKSSLALALFRVVEPAGGSVVVDGVDLAQIGLRDLRSALTIIPQDPVLFAGSVRSNLDPFGALDDAMMWSALRRAHLVTSTQPPPPPPQATNSNVAAATLASPSDNDDRASEVSVGTRASPDANGNGTGAGAGGNGFVIGLDTPIAEGGGNLSVGQRQLLCLARALARSSRVIVLDEATASVDTETDARIQDTIRSELADATVFTIAHRLKTIVDYDRVLVLDKGVVAENGAPLDLMMAEGGQFRAMCEETGEFDELVAIAQEAAERRRTAEGGA